MRHVVRNGIFLLIVTLCAIGLIYPPKEAIRLGKDLRGGTSLVYAVDVAPTDPFGVISQVIEVIKNRLDPNGVMEISIVAQGNDRIEITMPLPSEEVKSLHAEFEATLQDLATRSIKPDTLNATLALPVEERAARLRQLAGGPQAEAAMVTKLEDLAAKYDAAVAARRQYDDANRAVKELRDRIRALEAAGTPADDPLLTTLRQQGLDAARTAETIGAQTAAPAVLDFEVARDEVLKASLRPEEVRKALQLSDRPVRKRDGETVVELDSPRKVAMDRIRADHPGAEQSLAKAEAAWAAYKAKARSFDDPEDIKRLLRGAGVLNFRITVDPGYPEEAALRAELKRVGPRNAGNEQARWFKINKIDNWVDSVQSLESLRADPAAFFTGRGYIGEEYLGEYWMLCWDRPGLRLTEADEGWQLAGAMQGRDQTGRPAIDFQMNTLGGQRLGQLTGDNVGRKMAILLDDEVYTAPVLNDRITTRGQISGSFSSEELRYIIQVLSAGSLQAKLRSEPISQSTVGPSLGKDNLRRGFEAGMVCFAVVAAFMIVYYFACGFISVIALAFNTLLLVAAMSAANAAFTLPGIAGVILTFGQAVDANVLIYERMREEFNRGADMRTAVRLGYSKALSAIVDGNVTTFIVCVVLAFTGTQEIKGFALTLGIGVVTTMFAQLFFTRWLFIILVDYVGWRRTSMLAMAFPAIQRWFTPSIDWMGLRYIAIVISLALTVLSVGVVAYQGRDLLGLEFRGGTGVTLQFSEDEKGNQRTLTRQEVEDRIRSEIIEKAPPDSPLSRLLEGGDVIVVNPIDNEGLRSGTFRIRTLLQDDTLVQGELVRAFEDMVESRPPLQFRAMDAATIQVAPVYPVISTALGDSIERPENRTPVPEYYGGVALVLDGITPPAPVADIAQRLSALRQQAGFSDTLDRAQTVVLLKGTEDAAESVVVLVSDPNVSFFSDEQRWSSAVRDREWTLVKTSLGQTTTLASVEKFSPAIAATFRAQAIVAIALCTLMIVIYVWVRFGSIRYSIAAITTTLHDCVVAVGLVALASIAHREMPGVAGALGLGAFKFDLNLVAAVLTTLGYSLNDTIIVMDRIRENRGRLPYASRKVINDSINQTISRTIITSGTTVIAVVALYVLGGEALRVFSYTMLIGIIIGTYSSIAVAAPLVWSRSADRTSPPKPSPAPADSTRALPA